MSAAISAASPVAGRREIAPLPARALVAFAMVAAVAVALTADWNTASPVDPDFTRLLRAMAALKALMAAGTAAAIFWRLQTVVPLLRLGAYAAACAAMAAGPVVIWGMMHVGLGALLLHGGLLASVLLLWRDPAVAATLSAIIVRRRAALRAG